MCGNGRLIMQFEEGSECCLVRELVRTWDIHFVFGRQEETKKI